eukprot:g1028.t1
MSTVRFKYLTDAIGGDSMAAHPVAETDVQLFVHSLRCQVGPSHIRELRNVLDGFETSSCCEDLCVDENAKTRSSNTLDADEASASYSRVGVDESGCFDSFVSCVSDFGVDEDNTRNVVADSETGMEKSFYFRPSLHYQVAKVQCLDVQFVVFCSDPSDLYPIVYERLPADLGAPHREPKKDENEGTGGCAHFKLRIAQLLTTVRWTDMGRSSKSGRVECDIDSFSVVEHGDESSEGRRIIFFGDGTASERSSTSSDEDPDIRVEISRASRTSQCAVVLSSHKSLNVFVEDPGTIARALSILYLAMSPLIGSDRTEHGTSRKGATEKKGGSSSIQFDLSLAVPSVNMSFGRHHRAAATCARLDLSRVVLVSPQFKDDPWAVRADRAQIRINDDVIFSAPPLRTADHRSQDFPKKKFEVFVKNAGDVGAWLWRLCCSAHADSGKPSEEVDQFIRGECSRDRSSTLRSLPEVAKANSHSQIDYSDIDAAVVVRMNSGKLALCQRHLLQLENLVEAFSFDSPSSIHVRDHGRSTEDCVGLCVLFERLDVVLSEERPYSDSTRCPYDFEFHLARGSIVALKGPCMSRVIARIDDATLYECPKWTPGEDAGSSKRDRSLVPILYRTKKTCMGSDEDEGVVVVDMTISSASQRSKTSRPVLDICANIQLRGICYFHRVVSSWILQIMAWIDYNLASLDVPTSAEAASIAAAVVAPSEFAFGNTVCRLFFSATDCIVEYSPAQTGGCAVVNVSRARLTSNVVSYGQLSGFKIEFDQIDVYIKPGRGEPRGVDVLCGAPVSYGVTLLDQMQQRNLVHVGRVDELHVFLRFFYNAGMLLEKTVIDVRGGSDRCVIDWKLRADSMDLFTKIIESLVHSDQDASSRNSERSGSDTTPDEFSTKVSVEPRSDESETGGNATSPSLSSSSVRHEEPDILSNIDFHAFEESTNGVADDNGPRDVECAPDTIEKVLIDEYYRPPDSPKAVYLRDEGDWTVFDFTPAPSPVLNAPLDVHSDSGLRRPDLSRGISVDSARSEKKSMMEMEKLLRASDEDMDEIDDEDDEEEEREDDMLEFEHVEDRDGRSSSPSDPAGARNVGGSLARPSWTSDIEPGECENRREDDEKYGVSSMMVHTGESVVRLDLDDSVELRKQLARLLETSSEDTVADESETPVSPTPRSSSKITSRSQLSARDSGTTTTSGNRKTVTFEQCRVASLSRDAEGIDGAAIPGAWFDGPKSVNIISNHIETPSSDYNAENIFQEGKHSSASTQIFFREVNIIVRLCAGLEWPSSEATASKVTGESSIKMDRPAKCDRSVSTKSSDKMPVGPGKRSLLDAVREDHYVMGTDVPSLPIHIGSTKAGVKSRANSTDMLEIRLRDFQMRLDAFAMPSTDASEEATLASTLEVAIRNITVTDRVASSSVRSMFSYWEDEDIHPRVTNSNAVRLKMEIFHPGKHASSSHGKDIRARLCMLPMRLNLDQDTLQMVTNFFGDLQAARLQNDSSPDKAADGDESTLSLGPFFRVVEVAPVKLMIDYVPTRIPRLSSIGKGDILSLLRMIPLNRLELTLCEVTLESVSGCASVVEQIGTKWCDNVLRKQLHRCLAGVQAPPIRALTNVGSGAVDLVLLPIVQYRQDGRAFLGLQRGATSFFKALSVETLAAASLVTSGARTVLETVGSAVTSDALTSPTGARYSQPVGVADGINRAYETIVDAVHRAARCVIAVPIAEYEQVGPSGAVRSIIRAVPVAMLSPAIGATGALSEVLLGARNSIDPKSRLDEEKKFKRP